MWWGILRCGRVIYNPFMKVVNKKARFDYDIGDVVEAGVMLTGAEVKSVKAGQVDMSNAHVRIRAEDGKSTEAWLINMHIYPYTHASGGEVDPARRRKLLLHQAEMVTLQSKMKQGRLLLVPTAIYTTHGKIKVELGLARGKRKYEKREVVKKRDEERDAERYGR